MSKKYSKLFILSLILGVSSLLITSLVWADDDEDEHEDRYDQGDPQVETKTTTSTKVIVETDSDGDGILDNQDPHPDIAEIYIVEDQNRNGIVDQFENMQDIQSDED